MIIAAVMYSPFPVNEVRGLSGYGGAPRFWEGFAHGLDEVCRENGPQHELWIFAPGKSTSGIYANNFVRAGGQPLDLDALLIKLKELNPDIVIGNHPYCLSGEIVGAFPHLCRIVGYKKQLGKYRFLKNFVTNSYFGRAHYKKKNWPVIYQCCHPDEVEFVGHKQDYFLFMSNITRGFKEKGLLTAINLANKTGIDLHIVGPSGGDRSSLKRLKKIISGRKNIKYVGPLSGEAKKMEIANAKALLYPIDDQCKEMGSTTVIECAYCGTPVITNDVGCMPEYVCHGRTGYLCNNEDEYIKAINDIEDINPFDCCQWAETLFDWRDIAEKYINLCQEIIEKN